MEIEHVGDNARWASIWDSALWFAILLRSDPEALPDVVTAALDVTCPGHRMGRPSDAEKDRMRESVASLPNELAHESRRG